MTQTLALLLDAYRELNARKMFWITLVISALVVCVLFFIGLSDDQELVIFGWNTSLPLFGITLDQLLKSVFVGFGIGFWLTWIATILALISTASIMPDFASGGSIDLMLCKPINRMRLLLTKYVGGLLFVALQVAAFSAAAFAIIGARSGAWEPGLFIAVPVVVVFFSYLYCVCALVGLVTRSTIASLLITGLFWLLLFGLNTTDTILVMPRVANEMYVERLEERVETLHTETEVNDEQLTQRETQLAEARESLAGWRKWHNIALMTKSVLPKTDETVALLERWLIDTADLPEQPEDDAASNQDGPFITREMRLLGINENNVAMRMQEEFQDRSLWWVVGTSLIFEAVVLALAGWFFCRRDF